MCFKISLAHKFSSFVSVNNLYYLSRGEINFIPPCEWCESGYLFSAKNVIVNCIQSGITMEYFCKYPPAK